MPPLAIVQATRMSKLAYGKQSTIYANTPQPLRRPSEQVAIVSTHIPRFRGMKRLKRKRQRLNLLVSIHIPRFRGMKRDPGEAGP